MTDLRKAAEMALETLDSEPKLLVDWINELKQAREELRQALAQPKWVGLTDEDKNEIYKVSKENNHTWGMFMRDIEAKLKEKNT